MHYIGSKLSLLPFLDESIFSIVDKNCKTFCDLFAGTGIVSRHFKSKGFSIISNDIQYYSYILNKHYIENNEYLNFYKLESEVKDLKNIPNKEKYIKVFDYLDKIENKEKGFIYLNYSLGGTKNNEYERLYFTDNNALKCDNIRIKIEEWFNYNKIDEREYYFLIASLLESVDKCANTTSVYGAFLKGYKQSSLKTFNYIPVEFLISKNHNNRVYNKDANELIKDIEVDILYLDPPYNRRQYCDNYHILETIAKYDNPKIKGKTGLRVEKKKSLYCNKNEVLNTFNSLIQNTKAKYIFLSYNNEGLLSLEDIKKIMSNKGDYKVFTKEYNRYKADNNRKYLSDKTIEYLHCCICR